MNTRRKTATQAFIKKCENRNRIIPKDVKQAVFDLFADENFISLAADVFRDFINATWFMQNHSHVCQLQKKLLLNPMNDLIRNQVNTASFSLSAQEISPFVKTICAEFLFPKKNAMLCENILKKWITDEHNHLGENLDAFLLAKQMTHETHIGLNAIEPALNRAVKSKLLKEIVDSKINLFNELSNDKYTDYFNKWGRTFSNPNRYIPNGKKILIPIFITLLAITWLITKLLRLPDKISNSLMIGSVLLCIYIYNHDITNVLLRQYRTNGYEGTELTNHFITEVFLKSISEETKTETEEHKPAIKPKPEKKQYGLFAKSDQQIATEEPYNDFSFPPETKKIIKLRKKEVKETIKKVYYAQSETKKMPVQQPIVWKTNIAHTPIYKFKPHKLDWVIVPLQSNDGYIKTVVQNDFIMCNFSQIKFPHKMDQTIIDEFYRLGRKGVVVKGFNKSGIVYREGIDKDSTYCIKVVHKKSFSHYRLFFKPLNEAYKAYEGDKVVNKVLHIPYKLKN